MKKNKSNTKENVFQAVNELYKNDGIEALTLEKIAKRAGISKGGLLYHFPTKDAILIGLVERGLKAFTENVKMLIDEIDAVDEKERAEKLEYFVENYVSEYLDDLEPGIMGVFLKKPALARQSREIDIKVNEILMKYFDDPEEIILLSLALEGYFFVKSVGYDFILQNKEEQIKQIIIKRLKKRIKRG